jgi:carbon monoxide dehydrogenase subunit G
VGTFTETVTSTADVASSRGEVWARLVDPDALVRLTPLLTRIDAHGDTWVWHLSKVGGLGLSVQPCFTEHMVFVEEQSIDFTHQPPGGSKEWIGVTGHYELSDHDRGVHLAISLEITADLPLPGAAGPAVRKVMRQTMQLMGDRFSKNLLADLGVAAGV